MAELANLPKAISIDVNHSPWCSYKPTAIFSANSLHIMSAGSVENFFKGAGELLQTDGTLAVYGPFKYAGEFTTASNKDFDYRLKDRDSMSGIRDFELIKELAAQASLTFIEDNAMPANNQLLVWKKAK